MPVMRDAKQGEPKKHEAIDKLTNTLYNPLQIVAERGLAGTEGRNLADNTV